MQTKTLMLLAPAILASAVAHADFDPRKPFDCQASDGSKVIANDTLVGGQGKAIVGSIGSVYTANAYANADHTASVYLSSSMRSGGWNYELKMDTTKAQVTTRGEGDQNVQYYYVPSTLVEGMVFQKNVAAKCFQAAN